MSDVSRLGAAEDGLLAAIQAQALVGGSALAGVTIELGTPSEPQREHVWVGESALAEQSHAVTRPGQIEERDEVLEVICHVLVARAGDVYKASRDRALALAGEIERAVRGDYSLGGAVEDAEVIKVEKASGQSDEGHGVEVLVTVRAAAWLA